MEVGAGWGLEFKCDPVSKEMWMSLKKTQKERETETERDRDRDTETETGRERE